MTKRLKENVVPICNDKYYVYALFKPNSYNPFYVGKGIRNRTNDHFKVCNLLDNTAMSINAPAQTAFCPSTPSVTLRVSRFDL